MIKTINKYNWSGDSAKIRINDNKKTVSLYGVCGSENWEVFKLKKIDLYTWEINHKGWELPLAHVTIHAKCFIASNGYCERESNCLYTATAQLLYNVL